MNDLTPPVPGQITTSHADTGLIDADVHPVVPGGIARLAPYLPRAWNERFTRKEADLNGASAVPLRFTHPNGSVLRRDARTPDGGLPGSSPDFLIADLLDRCGTSAAVMTCLQAGSVCVAQAGLDESIVLARAYNDFFLDQWLPRDPRLRFAPAVPVQDPTAAAEEVRRIGSHQQVAAIWVPMINLQLGSRWFWPLYAAAEELDLPVFLHVTGMEGVLAGAPVSSAGSYDSYIDRYLAMPQLAESALRNLVFSGTMDQFPRLLVVFAEYGFSWVMPLVWRMERLWRGLRHDVPWVKKPPMEYVRERCFFTTQPIDEPADPADLARTIAMLGTDRLCFSSDYPHWDNDMPAATLRFLEPADRRKIFADNARRAFRLG